MVFFLFPDTTNTKKRFQNGIRTTHIFLYHKKVCWFQVAMDKTSNEDKRGLHYPLSQVKSFSCPNLNGHIKKKCKFVDMIQELVKQKILLQKEYEYEKKEFQRQTENTGVARKVQQGLCWFPLYVKQHFFNSLNQHIVVVERVQATDIEHQFEPGKPVCFFMEDCSEKLHYMRFIAQVSFVQDDEMHVIMPNEEAVTLVENTGHLGIQLYLDEYTYKLMFKALDRVITAKGDRLAELRDICHTTMPLQKGKTMPIRFPWLNVSQQQAVNEILWAKDVAVVHGPPGTGKTTTLVEAIYETLRRETQVLVCAQSNMAVDWIAEKLSDRGINVLRIGNPTRVTDKMLADTYERRFEAHPDYIQLWNTRRAIRALYTKKDGNRTAIRDRIMQLRQLVTELEYRIRESILAEARVIACTLTGSANPVLNGVHFHTLFIDEAAQALEAACWIAAEKADRIILAGDHCQLPPVIKCPEALHGGLDHTLMQQIVEQKPDGVSLLTIQYRMCDGIMQFPNMKFYGGQLTSDKSVRFRSILDWDTSIDWLDYTQEETDPSTENREEYADNGTSWQNPTEAAFTLRKLKEYILKIGTDRILYEHIDIGIISPYKGQTRLLRRLMGRDGFWKRLHYLITVNTIDGFQGQERDIVVISLVRSNAKGELGFLTDLRRLNVAITRARTKLLLIGDRKTLGKHPFFQDLIRYVDELTP